jgi:hypothetical protein
VQVVDILGHHGDAAARDMGGPFAFEAGEPVVGGVGVALLNRGAAHVVESQDQIGARSKASGVATSSTRCCSHRPPPSRKVSMPLSALIPRR